MKFGAIFRLWLVTTFCSSAVLSLAGLAQQTLPPGLDPQAVAAPGEKPAADTAATKETAPPLDKKEAQALIAECQAVLTKTQDTLRIVSAKLPSVITDNGQFRRIDKTLELCREDIYPAEVAANKLKSEPRRLHDLVKLYLSTRMLQLRLQLLSDRLMQDEGAAQASNAIFEINGKVGRLALKLHPYVYKVVDAYEASVGDSKLDSILPLQEGTPGSKF